MTAYHEHTHQKRAVINLSKASRLVDDKTTLVANPSPRKGGRRKSAFAEEDEGYAYVEEGFRIRFANGETIDFYADSRAKKDEWMEVLSQVVGRPDAGKRKMGWTDLVLAREKAGGLNVEGGSLPASPVKQETVPAPPTMERKPLATKSAPTSPVKRPAAMRTQTEVQRPRTPPMKPRTGHRSRDAVKSMIF